MAPLDTPFSGKKVLVSGHTGFKGSWLAWMLIELGADVVGFAQDPHTNPSHFDLTGLARHIDDRRLDVRDPDRVRALVREVRPDFVFHLAAQALVRESYTDPYTTYSTNVLGTLNVLEALRTLDDPVTAVMITSDKAYENREWVWSYRENDALGGSDPYSASKAAAEVVLSSHLRSFFPSHGHVRLGIARAGNVIGGGDWAANRIVPDCIRSWLTQVPAEIRSPRSTRPWQHVLEPLGGYIALATRLADDASLHGEAFNFGPLPSEGMTVADVVNRLVRSFPDSTWSSGEPSNTLHEAGLLQLNCDKARLRLGWQPRLDFASTVDWTADWYRRVLVASERAEDVTRSQIANFFELAGDASR